MKPIPKTIEEIAPTPEVSELNKSTPETSELNKTQPTETEPDKIIPEATKPEKNTPEASELNKEMPPDKNLENCVTIGDKTVEIKPTKLKYFRNKMASAYSLLKTVPLNELLSYDAGILDASKDADKILFDFLVAVFDDSDFVKRNYDEMTADDVEKVFKIFGRLNHIDEKEEAIRKNKEAQQAKR